jgi:hypothetical protein
MSDLKTGTELLVPSVMAVSAPITRVSLAAVLFPVATPFKDRAPNWAFKDPVIGPKFVPVAEIPSAPVFALRDPVSVTAPVATTEFAPRLCNSVDATWTVPAAVLDKCFLDFVIMLNV